MKKYLILVLLLFTAGCGNSSQKNVIKSFTQKFEKSNGYYLKGNLSVHNNDDVYDYKIDVLYKKDNYYKVNLTNTANSHTQVILKNSDGVFVLTPALNKSFKFQSDWPYDNSQIYLVDALIKDINNDKDLKFKVNKDKFVIQTKVNYPNNNKLVKQKIFLDSKRDLEKVVVYDKNDIDSMTMTFDKIKYSPKLTSNDFKIDSIIEKKKSENVEETASFEDVIYPLFVPDGTKLVNEENVSKEQGKRVIMNYDGEKSFLLVEETADVFKDLTIIPSSGEPFPLMDTMGVMTDNSLSWSSGGVDFYIVSDVMSMNEMVEVAQSIGTISSIK